jgi:hypothetical protein
MKSEYGIKYKIEKGTFSPDQLKAEDAGGTDELLWASIINGPDGSLSVQWASTDNQGKPLSMKRIFQAWAMLAANLGESDDLPFEFRDTAKSVHERVKKYILSRRDVK